MFLQIMSKLFSCSRVIEPSVNPRLACTALGVSNESTSFFLSSFPAIIKQKLVNSSPTPRAVQAELVELIIVIYLMINFSRRLLSATRKTFLERKQTPRDRGRGLCPRPSRRLFARSRKGLNATTVETRQPVLDGLCIPGTS